MLQNQIRRCIVLVGVVWEWKIKLNSRKFTYSLFGVTEWKFVLSGDLCNSTIRIWFLSKLLESSLIEIAFFSEHWQSSLFDFCFAFEWQLGRDTVGFSVQVIFELCIKSLHSALNISTNASKTNRTLLILSYDRSIG